MAATRRRRLDFVSIAVAPIGLLVILLAQRADGGLLGSLVQGPAAAIVFGGTLGAVLLSYRPAEILRAIRGAVGAFRMPDDDVDGLAAKLTELSIRAHRGGLLALEAELERIDDPLLRHGLRLSIDGMPLETVQEFLAAERSAREADEEAPARVFEAAAGYAPTFGILGAVLGLMRVMQNLETPSMLGPGMAVAFVATAYGVAGANLVLLPLAGRLRERATAAERRRDLIVQGLSAIHQRLHPSLVAQKVGVFTNQMPAIEELTGRIAARRPAPRAGGIPRVGKPLRPRVPAGAAS
jgi:chemotaxis protein MotA